MSKIKQPQTSVDAYKSLDPEKIAKIYLQIVWALGSIGPATYEGIAEYLKVEPVKIWKRMSEAHRLGLIHRTGNRMFMKSGRQGFVWAAGKGEEDSVKKKHRVLKGPTVSEYSKAILQPTLF